MSGPVDFLTIREAAELIGISPTNVARWAGEGRIPFSLTADGQRLFRREDIEKIAVIRDSRPEEDDE